MFSALLACQDGCRMDNSLQQGEWMEGEIPVKSDLGQEQCGYRVGTCGTPVLGSLFPQWFLLGHCSRHTSFKREKNTKSCWSFLFSVPTCVLLDITWCFVIKV